MAFSNHTFFNKKAGNKLTRHAKNCLLKAESLAAKFKCTEISTEHLIFAVYLERGSLGSNILNNCGLRTKHFRQFLKRVGNYSIIKSPSPKISIGLKRVLTRSFSVAKDHGYPYVGTEHLTYALLLSEDRLLKKIIPNPESRKVKHSIESLFDPNQFSSLSSLLNFPDIGLHKKSSSVKTSTTPHLDKFCFDISADKKTREEIIIGREKEIGRMIDILGRRNKNNPLLVGEPGVGKTALVVGLAQQINAGSVPSSLFSKRIMALDIAQLIAGTSFRGEFESRLKEIIKEASNNQDIILFIDEIHNIVGAGNVAGSLDLANILKPALSRGDLQVIGATTFTEFKKYIEKDAALERRFQSIQINEPTVAEARMILLGIRDHYEKFHNVIISDMAIDLAVTLSQRFIQNRFLPDKAIDVLDETASSIRAKNRASNFIRELKILEKKKAELLSCKEKMVAIENFENAISLRAQERLLSNQIRVLKSEQSELEKRNCIEILPENIRETVAKMSGVPLEKLSEGPNEKVRKIRSLMNKRIVGQKEIIDKLSSTLLRSQAGIANPERPLGSFLFLGPTGVGKTLTAQILAREFFGSSRMLIRIDMSELMERHSVSSLLGSPAGYVGYGEGGNLTEKIRRNPYAVVLFDEIEKAHPEIFNILLQILEDGTLTDAEGTLASFKNAIIILTSNIGTEEFTSAARLGFENGRNNTGARQEKFNLIKEQSLGELERQLRPELINRLDHILVFNALGVRDIRTITKLELKKLVDRLAEKNICLKFPKKLIDHLAARSLAFNQGARLVRKNIQEFLENPIAEMMIYNKVKNNRISVAVAREKIIIS